MADAVAVSQMPPPLATDPTPRALSLSPPGARAQRAWGSGRLSTKAGQGRTRLETFYQEGCAKLRLPEMFDGTMEAVLINSSGGLTGGDRMEWRFAAGPQTQLTLTTQACERIYKASAGTAEIDTRLTVGEGARLDWLPQETILFDRAALARSLEVDLAEDATFLAVEAVLLGRKAMGETVRTGAFRDRWRIRREGRLLHADQLALEGEIAALARRQAVLGGGVAFASLVFCAAHCAHHVAPLRRLLGPAQGGVSHVTVGGQDKLVIRLIAEDGFSLRKTLVPMISHLRMGASLPKVWNL
ncbi:urease accessory protein UreD [Rhizobium rhizosphaerae]|uniref:urease accessory protein UreD n=1 Tax=Xaviernesmea rhizosphaerae TaxID=1672749 RepID=UPI000AE0210F|nr:urease accessory protein UreD [Xaviernesmea rhizosphaerae]